jgi:hypothetical protein
LRRSGRIITKSGQRLEENRSRVKTIWFREKKYKKARGKLSGGRVKHTYKREE